MATWHQEQARKQPGFKLYHETKWTVLHDPPGEMSSSMLFDLYREAYAYEQHARASGMMHYVILRPARRTWIEVSVERYLEMLGIMPPAAWVPPIGFLVGEAWDHDGEGRSRFAAFVRHNGQHFEATLPMTVLEFRQLDLAKLEYRARLER
jgi:hypothetical protein